MSVSLFVCRVTLHLVFYCCIKMGQFTSQEQLLYGIKHSHRPCPVAAILALSLKTLLITRLFLLL